MSQRHHDLPQLAVVAAMTKQTRAIGIGNALPWHLPADLKRFKALTTGKRIIMGRNTYESIGRPLPGRDNVVVSSAMTEIPNVTVVRSLADALRLSHYGDAQSPVFVIGGQKIFSQIMAEFAPQVRVLHLTEIDFPFDGDTFFPAFASPPWRERARETHHHDGEPSYHYDFVDYERP